MTQAIVFSADDGCDVGEGTGARVSPMQRKPGSAHSANASLSLLTVVGVGKAGQINLTGCLARSSSLSVLINGTGTLRIPCTTVSW